MKFEDLLMGTRGRQLNKLQTDDIQGIGTDTRKSLAGQAFFALRGENFDAHKYMNQAIDQGAVVVVVDDEKSLTPQILNEVACIQVNDTLVALQDLAHYWRKKWGGTIVALTGSNGKTTTKDFLAHILGSQRSVLWSQGSFNNHWGVPLTLLRLTQQHECAVLEMGMNHAGEIKRLCEIAEPNIVLCTNVGRAHIGNFESQEHLARAKEEIYKYSAEAQIGIFNLDNSWTIKMLERWGKQAITVSEKQNDADVYLQLKSVSTDGLELHLKIKNEKLKTKVPIFGAHNVSNLGMAMGAALAVGMSPDQIVKPLQELHFSWGRHQIVTLKGAGHKALFDAYNANPDSFAALVGTLKGIDKDAAWVGLFGEMLELGDDAEQAHRDLATQLAKLPFDKIYFIGDSETSFANGLKQARYSGEYHGFKPIDKAELVQRVQLAHDQDFKDRESFYVVKGSRGLALEDVLKPLALSPTELVKK